MSSQARPQNPPIRLAVVADVRLYRERLAQSLSARDGFIVVGTADDQVGALSLARESMVDLLVLDMAMVNSLDVVRAITAEIPSAKVVAFAVNEVEADVIACAEAGIVGYVSREASLDDLMAVVRSAARDELISSPRIASKLLRRAATAGPLRRPANGSLTRREQEIWSLLERGLSNKEIATELGIEVSTAKNHVHNLLDKLDVSTRAEAAALVYAKAPTLPSRSSYG